MVIDMETIKKIFTIICISILLVFVAILNAVEGMIYALAWIIYYIDHGLHILFKKILDITDYLFNRFNVVSIYNEVRNK